MFQIIWIVISGLIIGALARAVLRGRQQLPLWLTIVAGIIGALIGNVIASAAGVRHTGGVDWVRHVLQIAVAAGAIVILQPIWRSRSSRR
ncbi:MULTISPECIES: GlsB/YeaQ/YmgE family stress response membrane protein [unclassified Pseudofrankia]|uniref:GlsB/YeaQ/YmgE family stress response membrane protein n=1 Tax=unclassified Pseudofrankia TaxID=2994372 RepID=UPI0008DA73DA|nr:MULTISPECIES: GlsB/YeaQ/YmgE family stress response membrane protein [unclassified Pseudofrankia]MDT3442140.1 GlsB/YeaQ/YmgE family stress response membrane protein [Pseudofrankia sp. BMG5.37]OHV47221.1 hypothetical protein BCD48_19425 [Pseudofrankia sp. BMG5.36]